MIIYYNGIQSSFEFRTWPQLNLAVQIIRRKESSTQNELCYPKDGHEVVRVFFLSPSCTSNAQKATIMWFWPCVFPFLRAAECSIYILCTNISLSKLCAERLVWAKQFFYSIIQWIYSICLWDGIGLPLLLTSCKMEHWDLYFRLLYVVISIVNILFYLWTI